MDFVLITNYTNKERADRERLADSKLNEKGERTLNWVWPYKEFTVKEIQNRLLNGDRGYVIHCTYGSPVWISRISKILSYEETEKNDVKRDAQTLEVDYEIVHSQIIDYLTLSGNKVDESIFQNYCIVNFDRVAYDAFLKENKISYAKLSSDIATTKEMLLDESFISEEILNKILSSLEYKKNVILQGPPGVGKTFLAKKLAYLQIGYRDSNSVRMVQFHQSYTYEDFIQGYKPEEGGGFKLKNGIFYEFCKTAQADPTHSYFFIIDEINRGNLSKIFGELMMLMEADKRGSEYAMPLTYSKTGETFYIPENLYLIGLMNTADRSLAVVDYALRRRFAFINLQPVLEGKFADFLKSKGVSEDLTLFISKTIGELNKTIELDPDLGKGFAIGHSYFCSNINGAEANSWYNQVIENEIGPMLEEYWYDEPEKAAEETGKLLYRG